MCAHVPDQVKNNALDLSRDTYGNYVIQHSLQHGDAAQRCAHFPCAALRCQRSL
jgi:hypothetical protein